MLYICLTTGNLSTQIPLPCPPVWCSVLMVPSPCIHPVAERGHRIPEAVARLYFRDMAKVRRPQLHAHVCSAAPAGKRLRCVLQRTLRAPPSPGAAAGWRRPWYTAAAPLALVRAPLLRSSDTSLSSSLPAGAGLPPLPACRAWRPQARKRADGGRRPSGALRLWLQASSPPTCGPVLPCSRLCSCNPPGLFNVPRALSPPPRSSDAALPPSRCHLLLPFPAAAS